MARVDEDLKRKIIMMMTFRMVIIITLLGSAILIQLVSRTILPINPLYFLIFLTSFFTLTYSVAFNRTEKLELLAYFQFSGDVLVITLLLYFTGGVKSPFSFLYILVVITGSILLYRRGSLFIASISAICYGTLVDLLYYDIIPYYDYQPSEILEISTGLIYYYIFIHICGFYATALLSSYLSERLKRTRTALEEMDEDLSDLKLLHQKIIDSMNTGLIITSLDGRINFCNEAGLQILGLPTQNILGYSIQSLFREPLPLSQFRVLLEENKLDRIERSFMKNQVACLIGMNLSFLHSQKGTPSGLILIFQDITQVRRMEQQIRMQERMAALGTMAAGIAHEVRNPLAAIRGSVQILRDDLALSDDQHKLMEIVMTESVRLDHTIQNFLNYAKPKQVLRRMEDLKTVIQDMLGFIQKGPDVKEGHRIEFTSSPEEFIHEFDVNQIKQVIWNLSINALHAMPSGGTLKVILEHDPQGGVVLTFQDEGLGIDSDRIESIFDPFQKSTTGGSGLGMAIVYRIVHDHQGDIGIESKPGQGTAIRLKLPAHSTQLVQPLLK
jgi:two-component system sensor histidine kinase PilS (NtrC family)